MGGLIGQNNEILSKTNNVGKKWPNGERDFYNSSIVDNAIKDTNIEMDNVVGKTEEELTKLVLEKKGKYYLDKYSNIGKNIGEKFVDNRPHRDFYETPPRIYTNENGVKFQKVKRVFYRYENGKPIVDGIEYINLAYSPVQKSTTIQDIQKKFKEMEKNPPLTPAQAYTRDIQNNHLLTKAASKVIPDIYYNESELIQIANGDYTPIYKTLGYEAAFAIVPGLGKLTKSLFKKIPKDIIKNGGRFSNDGVEYILRKGTNGIVYFDRKYSIQLFKERFFNGKLRKHIIEGEFNGTHLIGIHTELALKYDNSMKIIPLIKNVDKSKPYRVLAYKKNPTTYIADYNTDKAKFDRWFNNCKRDYPNLKPKDYPKDISVKYNRSIWGLKKTKSTLFPSNFTESDIISTLTSAYNNMIKIPNRHYTDTKFFKGTTNLYGKANGITIEFCIDNKTGEIITAYPIIINI